MKGRAPIRMLNEWRGLYQQAAVFVESTPWNVLSDDQLFAVEDPGTGEVAYCAIMGAGGIEYGLAAYRGTAGLKAYAVVANDAADEDEHLLIQDCLTFSLGNRDEVFPEDRAVHKALGLRFRGRGAWPIFRSFRPGYLPAMPTAQEAAFLRTCLEQSDSLVEELVSGHRLPALDPASQFPARRRTKAGTWATTSLPYPPAPQPPCLEVDDLSIRKVQKELPRASQTWQAAVQAVAPIAEKDSRAFWAWIILCVDQDTGLVLIAEPAGPEQSVQAHFMRILQQGSLLPKEVRVSSGLLEAQLAPLLGALGIRLRRVDRLRELERVSRSFKAAVGRR